MKILSCNSNIDLAKSISKNLNSQLVKAEVKRFSDMEVFVEVQENVRGEDMFIIQSTSYPANDNLMELLVSLDALRRASARRIPHERAGQREWIVYGPQNCRINIVFHPVSDHLHGLFSNTYFTPSAALGRRNHLQRGRVWFSWPD